MIKLDLRNLTQAHIEEARPNEGRCSYSSPCIIGALMTPEERASLATSDFDLEDITHLVANGIMTFTTPEQAEQARTIQFAFDCLSRDEINRALKAINPELSF